MTDPFDEFLAAATRATPGPWQARYDEIIAADRAPFAYMNTSAVQWQQCDANAAYLALCSPERMAALVEFARATIGWLETDFGDMRVPENMRNDAEAERRYEATRTKLMEVWK